MDKFKNRLKYYLLGLSLGVLVVYVTFGNRSCSWLPENRVKNMIGEKEIIVGDSIISVMNCLNITNDDIYSLLKTGGEVEFSKSITDAYPKVYYIEEEKDNVLYWAKFALYDNYELSDQDKYAEVIELFMTGADNCETNTSNKLKSTLPLPHDDVIAILESHEFRILDKAVCQMAFYSISEEELFSFHKTMKRNICDLDL